jgi:hypothetical protein
VPLYVFVYPVLEIVKQENDFFIFEFLFKEALTVQLQILASLTVVSNGYF